jgi:hypothetical protein
LMPLEFLAALVGAAMVFPDIGAVIYLIAAALFVAVQFEMVRFAGLYAPIEPT